MNAEQNAVLENVQAPVGPIAPATPAVDLNTQQLPGIAQPTDAEKATLVAKLAAEAKAKEETALARFDTNVGFKLEGQVIGQAVKDVERNLAEAMADGADGAKEEKVKGVDDLATKKKDGKI